MFNEVSQIWRTMGNQHSFVGRKMGNAQDWLSQGKGAAQGAWYGRSVKGVQQGRDASQRKEKVIGGALLLPRTIYDLAAALFNKLGQVLATAVADKGHPNAKKWGKEATNHWKNVNVLWERVLS